MGPHGIAGKAALDTASLGRVETRGVEVGHSLGEAIHPHGHNRGEVKRPHGIAGKAALEAAILGQGETDGVEVGHKLGEGVHSHDIAVEAGVKNEPPESSRGQEIMQHRLFQ